MSIIDNMSSPITIKYPNKNNVKIVEKLDTVIEDTEIIEEMNINSSSNIPTTLFKKSSSFSNLSFSICVDSKKTTTLPINKTSRELLGCTPPEKDFLLTKLTSIYPKSDGKWINSSLVLSCQSCMSIFGIFLRKHHCRACGCVFCSTCCYKTIVIPDNFIQKPQEDIYKYKISSLTKWLKSDNKSLVCNECFKKITILNQITWIIKICEFLDFVSLNKVLLLSNSWYKAGIHQLSKFREIQYKCSTLFTTWELEIMWNSRNYFTGHNNWLIMLIKSNLQKYYNIKLQEVIFELSELIDNHKKNISCWSLMCSRKCNIDFDIMDFIDIMQFVSLLEKNHKLIWTDKLLQEFLLLLLQNILDIEFQSDNDIYDKIKSAIPLICSIFINLINLNENLNNEFLENIFSEFVKIDNCIINFYLETQYLDNILNKDICHMHFINFLEELVKKYNLTNITIQVNKTIDFFTELYKNKSLILTEPILNPLNLNEHIMEIKSVEILKSNTQPLLVYARVSRGLKGEIIKFIVKKDESLRKESIVACLIKLLQERLIKQAGKNRIKKFDRIPTYQIIMLTKNLAIIEFVENSLTLRMISNNKFTLQNYILDNNPTEQVDTVKRRFLQSLAISSSLSYILGLGDRHLDNIMINNLGQLFHIDYGYLMDNPTTSIISNPNIKVTTVMIDFLGGVEGKYYKEFTQYIIQVYDILRLYKNIIISYYEMLGNEQFIKWEVFKPKLEDRFLSGLTWKDIEVTLINEIENSNSYPSIVVDLCHHYKQILAEYISKKN
jgi:hypothetical protein